MGYIYKYKREDGTAAYIGQTNDISKRHEQHMKDDEWCNEMVFELFYSQVDDKIIDDIEKMLIQKEHPTYNIMRYPDFTPAYELNNVVDQLKWVKYTFKK